MRILNIEILYIYTYIYVCINNICIIYIVNRKNYNIIKYKYLMFILI